MKKTVPQNHTVRSLKRKQFPKGVNLTYQGEPADCAYLIQTGKVRVYQTSEGYEYNLAVLGPGEIIGEMALFTNMKRSANVIAEEETIAIVLSPKIIDQKLQKSDPTIRAIVSMLSKRLIRLNDELIQHRKLFDSLKKKISTLASASEEATTPKQKEGYTALLQDHLLRIHDSLRNMDKTAREPLGKADDTV